MAETPPAMPNCVQDDFSEPLSHGACAMTALAFPDDGTRLFVNEDDDDHGLVFDKNADGTLTFVSESTDRFRIQGLATSPAGDVLYNGLNVYDVSGDGIISSVVSIDGGNATELMSFDGADLLVTTVRNQWLEVLDLADPRAPESVARLTPSVSGTRYQAHSDDGSRFVVVGQEGIASVIFDGETLEEQDAAEVTLSGDGCLECSFQAITRKVDLTGDGAFAIAGTFIVRYDDAAKEAFPDQGLVTTFSVDPATGELAELASAPLANKVRDILLVEPQ